MKEISSFPGTCFEELSDGAATALASATELIRRVFASGFEELRTFYFG